MQEPVWNGSLTFQVNQKGPFYDVCIWRCFFGELAQQGCLGSHHYLIQLGNTGSFFSLQCLGDRELSDLEPAFFSQHHPFYKIHTELWFLIRADGLNQESDLLLPGAGGQTWTAVSKQLPIEPAFCSPKGQGQQNPTLGCCIRALPAGWRWSSPKKHKGCSNPGTGKPRELVGSPCSEVSKNQLDRGLGTLFQLSLPSKGLCYTGSSSAIHPVILW